MITAESLLARHFQELVGVDTLRTDDLGRCEAATLAYPSMEPHPT
jgi:hypothetical protein